MSQDEVFEWAVRVSEKHKVGLFHVLVQFETVSSLYGMSKAVEIIERGMENEQKIKEKACIRE